MVNLTDGERETVKTVNQFIIKYNYTFPVFYDAASDAARKYKIFSIPTTIFVTKEGNIYETKIGLLNESYLNKKIEELLSL